MRVFSKWTALSLFLASIFAGQAAQGALVSSATNGGNNLFAVAGYDLANSNQPTFAGIALTSGTANFSSSAPALVEGTVYAGGPAGNTEGLRTLTPSDNAVLVISLNTAFSPAGYDIASIDTYTGTAQARRGQAYDVAFAFASDPGTFVPAYSVVGGLAGNVDSGTGETRVITVENAGSKLLGSGVANVRFTFHNCCAGSSVDESMFREIDVVGTATGAATPNFSQANLNHTAQILPADLQHELLAAVNLIYPAAQAGVAAPGTVNGIPFQNIAWDNGSAQALTQGGTVTISPVLGARQRIQSTASTIVGPDELVLESIANSINFLGANEQVSVNLANLPAGQNVRVQVIGGDNGTGLANWLGDIEVTVNGLVVGTWDIIADDNQNTASLATFFTATDAGGALNMTFRQVNAPPGQFAGIAGIIVTTAPSAIPEPGTLALLGLGALGLLRRRRAA